MRQATGGKRAGKIVSETLALLLTVSVLCAGGQISAEQLEIERIQNVVRHRIEAVTPHRHLLVDGQIIHGTPAVAAFYEHRFYRPAWIGNDGSQTPLTQLVNTLEKADRDGLDPEAYHLSKIKSSIKTARQKIRTGGGINYQSLVDLEILSTDAYLIYATHLLLGRVRPENFDPNWHVSRDEGDLIVRLEEALLRGDIEASLRDLLPRENAYYMLRDRLSYFRSIEAKEWIAIPAGEKLQRGDRNDRVPTLRRQLRTLKDLQGNRVGADALLFDADLEEAVKRFQGRHGLEPDGIVGSATLAALNVSLEERIQQIVLNLERWRWLPRDLGAQYILVNLAGFEMSVVEEDRPVLNMRVVVGRPYRKTPVFTGKMTYLVFNPYWHVPPALAVQDILPKVKKDPAYLEQEQIRVFQGWGTDAVHIDPAQVDWNNLTASNFPFRFRQEPGPRNSLGNVKFMFPNRFNVYLHDTPARELFVRSERAFSSGCIRVEKPMELAEYLLSGHPDWSKDRMEATLRTRKETTVPLPRPIPVHLLYWTVWIGSDGSIQFRKDIYQRDELLAQALQKTPTPPGQAAS